VKVTTTPKASRDLDEWIGRIAENNPVICVLISAVFCSSLRSSDGSPFSAEPLPDLITEEAVSRFLTTKEKVSGYHSGDLSRRLRK
jgi:hypothetical protein